jgi:hypothetical protein
VKRPLVALSKWKDTDPTGVALAAPQWDALNEGPLVR